MSKKKFSFVCMQCRYMATKWLGRCPQCSEWNSFEQEEVAENKYNEKLEEQENIPLRVNEIKAQSFDRYKTGIAELDRVLGGGITKGSLTLLGGEPGIGKSTLLMETCKALVEKYPADLILYISGEESGAQVAARAKRLGVKGQNFFILSETSLQSILQHLNKLKPKFLVLDSIQTTTSTDVPSAAGSVAQVREVTYEIMNYSKANNISTFIVGHVNKEGGIAGPKLLEHMVDTVVYFEGEKLGENRLLRAIKNRFGSCNEVGIFRMCENGLREVKNFEKYFLQDSQGKGYGRSLTCIWEGTRPLLVEIQALVVENKFGNGRRVAQGISLNRLALLIAVIDKYFEIPLSYNDIYINVVGGVSLTGRESDLAIIAALLSSYKQKNIMENTVLMGEVGLSGEIRRVASLNESLKELQLLGYNRVVCSEKSANEYSSSYGIEITDIKMANALETKIF